MRAMQTLHQLDYIHIPLFISYYGKLKQKLRLMKDSGLNLEVISIILASLITFYWLLCIVLQNFPLLFYDSHPQNCS